MTPEVRRAIVFVAGHLIAGKHRAVYDYGSGGYIHFSGNVGPQVHVFDHQSSSHITGSGNKLFHHKTGAHITLEINGKNFKGYDYGSQSHFTGSIRTNNVALFDYGEAKHFQYLLT